jgi:hypothetical protein
MRNLPKWRILNLIKDYIITKYYPLRGFVIVYKEGSYEIFVDTKIDKTSFNNLVKYLKNELNIEIVKKYYFASPGTVNTCYLRDIIESYDKNKDVRIWEGESRIENKNFIPQTLIEVTIPNRANLCNLVCIVDRKCR